MLTSQLIAQLGRANDLDPTLPVATGVAFHSGRVRPGDAFFALPGEREHGIEHAPDALARGASFIVSDRPHPRGITVADPLATLLAVGSHARSQLHGPVVAISGSAGKTSTRALAAAALQARSSEGNLNTPRALAAVLVDGWLGDPQQPLVLELGIDHPGEMDELVDLVRPSHGLLTVIGASHLEQLGSVAGVAREKARLLERSPERFASVDAARQLPSPLPGLIRYGLDDAAEVSGKSVDSGADGQTVSALGVEMHLPHPGPAMAQNALGALALAWRLGLDLEAAAARISSARLEPGRLERKRLGGRLVLDDSYNSNPASARAALAVLRLCPAPRTAVLGDMLELGRQSNELHRELGALTRGLEAVIAVGPQAREMATSNPHVVAVATVEEALERLGELPAGGTVLVKASRGVRLERVVAALAGPGEPA